MAEGLELDALVQELAKRPDLLEEISRLISAKNAQNGAYVPEKTVTSEAESPLPGEDAVRANSTPQATDFPSGGRHRLLGALKPYLSDGRAQAIDTLLGISDIFGMFKSR